jgi:hypothetical protein
VTRLSGSGVSVDLPANWEGAIDGGGFPQLADGARQPTVLHAGSFPLPVERGSFGSGATDLMNTDDIFIVLFEYGPDSVGTPLFQAEGMPRALTSGDFDRDALQHALPGQSGLQRFFTERGRAFCLYVVLGSHIDRSDLAQRVNQVLATIEIQ